MVTEADIDVARSVALQVAVEVLLAANNQPVFLVKMIDIE